jgi:nicotinate phosphoribosyltransferase
VRAILDASGRRDVKLVASGDVDEYRIDALLRAGVPYDAFGVGTAIVLTPDAPELGAVYKLVEVADRRGAFVPVAKRAPGKATYAGAKQVWRTFREGDGTFAGDTVAHAREAPPGGEALLAPLVRGGVPVEPLAAPDEAAARARKRAEAALARLPEAQRAVVREESIDASAQYPVTISESLRRLEPREG